MRAKKLLALFLSIIMLLGTMPMTAFAYWEEPSAEGNIGLETTVYDYTKPVGVTMQRLTGNCVAEFGEDGNLGDDFLFVIKSGDRYYAMKDVPASETAYSSIPAVDVTDWVNADGSLTVPADTLGVAFWRYEVRGISEYSMYVNGREDHLSYTYSYESVDGDNDYYNDAERNYWGKFVVTTYKEGDYTNTPYYWSENEVSGTLNFGGRWSYYISSYNSIYLKYELIVDLRDDGLSGKEFYFRYLGTDVEYVGDEVEGYLYYTDCRHQGTIRHAEYDAPTCMLKGCEEYWYCENCNRYYKDEAFTQLFGEEMPVIPATGHDFDSESCKNCSRPVPVYSKVTNQAQFDALADDTMFILVAEYNGKHYAMDFSEVYSYMTDSDGDGFFDIHNVDNDSDGIPDYLEFDGGGGGEYGDEPNGVYDYLEWDMDDDGDVDDYDLHEFHIMVCDQHLTDMLYANGSINATEITVNPDGTFSHEEAKKTAEFEMVDVYLAEDYNPEWHLYWENGEMPYHTKCVKQFVIPNYFLTAPSMRPIERMYQQRIYDFGDSSHWGVIFYDNREDYYSYVDGDMDEKVDVDEDGKPDPLPFPDVNKEGSVAVFDTFDDIMWILYNEGQMAQLRLRDYNGTIGFVTGHDYELEGWEWVDDDTYEDGGYYNTHDTQACVYLYASEQYDSHICDFGDWVDDENGRTHTHTCRDSECGKKDTKTHNWDNGVQTKAPTCTENGTTTYTCPDCKATKTEPIPALNHDFGDWTYDSVDSHIRHCKRENCNAEEFGGHEWGAWKPVDENTHKMTCSVCNGYQTDKHEFDNGVVTKEPTEWETGVKTYTCGDCSHTKTEPIDKLVHECVWSDWYPNGDENHKRDCMDDNCDKFETLPHEWDKGEITKEATCKEKGIKTYTCQTCMHTRTEDIPALTDHAWGEWVINKLDEANTHIRFCICNESQTAPHTFDEGKVTEEATHITKGVKTFTCTDGCGYSYTEEIPATPDHEWTNWTPCDNGTHIRSCRCNATETKGCEWGDGVVTAPACEKEGSTVYTCTVCGNTKTETKPALNHDWSDWRDTGNNAAADIHERICKREGCDAKQIGNHEWSAWTAIGSEEHKKTCAVCSGYRTSTHNWDGGVETIPATVTQSGVITYTCPDCSATKNEVIPKIVCDHTWGKWSPDDALTHTHICINENGCTAYQKQPHEWNEGVVSTEPTEKTEGIKTYTCLVCSFEKTESIPMLQHTHQFGEWTSDGTKTHTRRCINGNTCTAAETAEHACDGWGNNSDGTHSGKCSVCGAGIVDEHAWSNWEVQDDGSLKRTCTLECGAVEEMPVLKPIEDAVVNTTKTDSNDAMAELIVDNAMTLFNDVLTDEEQKAVSEGNTTVSVYLEVSDIPVNQLSSSDKAAAEGVIGKNDNELNEKTEIGMYLDINLFKEVTKTDENTSKTEIEESKITETSGKVTISIQIPDELINTNSSVERTYRIIRVHEDINGNLITDVIEGVFDPETKTFTFESDKFSTYALAYNDDVITYTVTYTDGVDASEIFADQKYTVIKGDATPAFVGAPARSGYTFKGWTPAVADTVTANVVYKAVWAAVITPPAHTHRYGTAWKTDGTNHWHECSCGAKKDFAAHSGGTATCEAKAKCSVCNAEYGNLAEHKYSEATCTKKATCSVCNAEKGELLSHSGGTATCKEKAKCSVCNNEYGDLAEHKYSEATCTKKATCSVCNAEKGELLSHSGGTATCKEKAKCSVCNAEYGDLAEHKYSEATCTKKATCSVCNAEKGKLLSHSGGTATCEAKAKCSVCNAEYGDLAEHKYSEATCIKKAKCSVCGTENGEFAEHKDEDGNNKCDACDTKLSQEQSSSPVVWILISTISVVLIAGAVVAVIFIKKKKGIA